MRKNVIKYPLTNNIANENLIIFLLYHYICHLKNLIKNNNKFIFIITFFFLIEKSNSQVCFRLQPTISLGAGTSSIIKADFNEDGKTDIAMTGAPASYVSIFLGDGLGNFSASTLPVSGTAYAVFSSDFNNDGHSDLAVAIGSSNVISVLLGTGLGGFGPITNFTVGSSPQAILSADFNGDNKVDLVSANYNSNNVSILLGNGNGNFSVATNYNVGTSPLSIINSDFNLDGKSDLAIANRNSSNVSILLGNGLGGFGTATNFSVSNSPQSIISADFNGDSKMDLALADGTNVSVLLGTGTGNFSTPSNYTAGSSPVSITSADFNNDGNMDLSVANNGSSNSSILLGNGLGNFNTPVNFSIMNGYPASIISGNFNGDSKIDFAVGANTGSTLSIYLATPIISINNVDSICLGATTTLTVTGASSYTWSANVGGVHSSTVNVTPTVNTIYSVTGYSLGCTNTKSTSISVRPLPILSITASSSIVCSGSNAILIANGASTYTWNTNSLSNQITVTPTISTNYTVTGIDNHGCSNSTTKGISVYPLPNLSIVSSNPTCYGLCDGSATVSASGNAPFTYSWHSPSTSTNSVATNLCYNNPFGVQGLTVTDNNGCQKTSAAYLTQPSPVSIIVNNQTLCTESSSTLTAIGALTYTWSTGQQGSTAIVTPTVNTFYTVSGTNLNGCNGTTNFTINPNPTANFNYTVTNMTVGFEMKDPTHCTSGGFLWDYGNGMTSTIAQQPFVTYSNPGVYTACLKCNSLPSNCVICSNITVPGNYTGATSYVGIEEIQENNIGVKIYPNPSNGLFTIESKSENKVIVNNVLGENIHTQNILIGKNSLNLNNQPNGIYFIKIQNFTYKIIVQN